MLEDVVAAYISSVWLRSDTRVWDTPDWFEIRNPASPMALHNAVRRCRLPADRLTERIAEVRAHHEARGSSVNWTVSPLDTQALHHALPDAGFELQHTMWGLIRDTRPLDPPPPAVDIVQTDDAARYARIAGRGWEMPDAFFDEFQRDVRTRMARGDLVAFIGSLDGQALATGKILRMPTTGYLMGGAVAPEARGRGLYRALVDARLTWLRERRIPTATLVALDRTSAPTCVRMGFQRVGDFHLYRWRPTPSPGR